MNRKLRANLRVDRRVDRRAASTRAERSTGRSIRPRWLAAAMLLGVNLPWGLAVQRAIAAEAIELTALTPNKSISLKRLPPETLPDTQPAGVPDAPDAPRSRRSQKGVESRDQPVRVAQRPVLQEQGRLEQGDQTLNDGSYFDAYPFSATAGQEIRIELDSSDFDTYLILVGPDGRPIAENDDRSRDTTHSGLIITLEQGGNYTIVANAYERRGRGSYTLTVLNLGTSRSGESGNTNGTTQPGPQPQTAPATPATSRPVSLTGDLATLAQADRLYMAGQVSQAEALYRQAKPDFLIGTNPVLLDDRINETQLSMQGMSVWVETLDAINRDRESEVERLWPRLVAAAPGFVDGQLVAAEYLIEINEEELVVQQLEELAFRFPEDANIARVYVNALREDRQRLEASIAARQFAIANPDHPEASAFNALADEYMGDFRRVLRERIALQGLGGVAIGVLTGRTNTAIFDGIQLAQLMAAGESGIGETFTAQIKRESKIIDDPEAVDYINRLGQDVAQRMGRDEFDYEFYIIEDESLNAFALPGGKVFVHTGALAAAKTEAELVGLLGHEVGHAVLSHGFKRIVRGQFLASLAREIPLGNVLYTLTSLDYSREHERQSDIIGTRVLANTGYAADGLRNFMATLGSNNPQRVPEYLSTHPAPASRVQYLEELVVRNGYNRYTYEGVEDLARIQARLGLSTHDAQK